MNVSAAAPMLDPYKGHTNIHQPSAITMKCWEYYIHFLVLHAWWFIPYLSLSLPHLSTAAPDPVGCSRLTRLTRRLVRTRATNRSPPTAEQQTGGWLTVGRVLRLHSLPSVSPRGQPPDPLDETGRYWMGINLPYPLEPSIIHLMSLVN